jgi:hypothetical protein
MRAPWGIARRAGPPLRPGLPSRLSGRVEQGSASHGLLHVRVRLPGGALRMGRACRRLGAMRVERVVARARANWGEGGLLQHAAMDTASRRQGSFAESDGEQLAYRAGAAAGSS